MLEKENNQGSVSMLALERKQKIIERLRQDRKVYVGELSRELDVTEETIRRDLKEIEKQGIAIRSHGGALLNDAAQVKPFSERETINHDLKTKIALCVQDFIEDGMVIMVDASTTTKMVIEHIDSAKHLTIITNSYTLIDQLSDRSNLRFIATGGEYYSKYKSYVGSDALRTIQRYNADLALLSCQSLSLDCGYTESNILEGDVKFAMSRQSSRTIEVADHTKFNRRSLANVLDFTDVDVLASDRRPETAWVDFFRQRKLTLVYPEASSEDEGELNLGN